MTVPKLTVEEINRALEKVRERQAVLVVSPAHEAPVRTALAELPWAEAAALRVVVSTSVPPGMVLFMEPVLLRPPVLHADGIDGEAYRFTVEREVAGADVLAVRLSDDDEAVLPVADDLLAVAWRERLEGLAPPETPEAGNAPGPILPAADA